MHQPDSKQTAVDNGDFPYSSWERVYQQSNLHELPWDTPEAHPLLVEMFKDHKAKSGARALDLGCGTGASSRLLTSAGYTVDAWDVSETAIARARALSKVCGAAIQFVAGNAIRDAISRADSYDLVLDFLFLHHVQEHDIETYFNGVRNSVRAGGRYVVGVLLQTDQVAKRASFFSDGEVRYWTQSEIERNLGVGFVCESDSYGNAGSADHNYPAGLFAFSKRGN